MIYEIWGDGLLEENILDRFKYRGRGRPRKTDYSVISTIQKKINTKVTSYLDTHEDRQTTVK